MCAEVLNKRQIDPTYFQQTDVNEQSPRTICCWLGIMISSTNLQKGFVNPCIYYAVQFE